MRRRIAHWGAAFLLLSSLMVRYAHPQEAAPECKTMEAVFGQQVVGLKPLYDLKGVALVSFNANLYRMFGRDVIDDDELLVYGPEDTFVVLVALKGKCVVANAIAPLRVIQKLMEATDI